MPWQAAWQRGSPARSRCSPWAWGSTSSRPHRVQPAQTAADNTLAPSGGFTALSTTPSSGDGNPGGIGAEIQGDSNNHLISVMNQTSPSPAVAGGTTAYVGQDADVTAQGGDVDITAQDQLTFTGVTGGVGIGLFAGVGGSVTIGTITDRAEAFIGQGATVSASGNINVKATFSDNVTADAYGGAAGARRPGRAGRHRQ